MDAVRESARDIVPLPRDTSQRIMAEQHTKINLIEDTDATGEVAAVYEEWRAKSGRHLMPGILKCFSHRPDFLREVMRFSDTVHFSEGHLNRKTKEAIASWVSYLNRCPY
jgi:alkylhydroperoxidase family enzyme